jgi:hypothetical protein
MNMKDFTGSKFLSAEDYPRPVVLTIVQVSIEELGEDKETKPVVWFEHVRKGMACNKTNVSTLIELYGDDSDQWVGNSIEVYVDPNVQFGGKKTPALRLRAPRQQQALAQPKSGMAPPDAVTDEPDGISDPGPPMRASAGRTRAPF